MGPIPVEHRLVDFDGDELLGVKGSDGKAYVGVRWVCRGVGLSDGQYQNQTRKLSSDPVLAQGVAKMQHPTDSGIQEVLFIQLDYLPLWLAKINAGIIEDEAVRAKVINYQLRAKDVLAEAFFPKPVALEDLIILQAQSVKELKVRVAEIEERAITAHHRIDSLDALDIEGDRRQRLEKMVKRFAWKQGIYHSVAWHHFDQAYNTAYRTNLTMLRQNYCLKRGLKEITRPDYLERVGKLDDAIRVVDKMLNPRQEATN